MAVFPRPNGSNATPKRGATYVRRDSPTMRSESILMPRLSVRFDFNRHASCTNPDTTVSSIWVTGLLPALLVYIRGYVAGSMRSNGRSAVFGKMNVPEKLLGK